MNTEVNTRADGKVCITFIKKDGKRANVGLTDAELLTLQMQISNYYLDKIKEDDYKRQADAIILKIDPNFVSREIAERKYTHKSQTFYEVKCKTKSEHRIWMFDIKDNKLIYRRYEGDFK